MLTTRFAILTLIFALITVNLFSQLNNIYSIVPKPFSLNTNGERFAITNQLRVSVTGHPDHRIYANASRFVRRMAERTGIFLDEQGFVTAKDTNSASSVLIVIKRPGKLQLREDESYFIQINSKQVQVRAETDLGAMHALETLMQLVSADSSGYYLPGLTINDKPRFTWRGLLLDPALHFLPVNVIKRTLDGMAAVKLNVLHLTLCNDQGFRFESKIFPRLQQLASDGNFYTQEQIKDIVNYASERGIRVVPEVVVPAHTTAILVAYPELATLKKEYTLQRYFGVFDPVLDPTNEKVYTFLSKLFTEVAGLFPDQVFHIGGDENTGKDWNNSRQIRTYMRANGIDSAAALQTLFNKKILPVITKNKKTMMGWDEIFQPGLPEDVIIQSWRGKQAFYESVKAGHDAVLSNGYYIDLIQPASYHYLNDPQPDDADISAKQAQHILGGEATMWGEHVTPETVDSRIWPRTAAIAERLWSEKDVRDVDDMYRRLDIVSLQLEQLGLCHLSFKNTMLRRLCNGYDTRALQALVDVIEPLKIYERNQGDTMYTIFSPYTKLADVATPDQAVPRIFTKQVDDFLQTGDSTLETEIKQQLLKWQNNHIAFLTLLRNSPVLQEAEPLSLHLSEIAATALEAIDLIQRHETAGKQWVQQKEMLLETAKEQGGRCELQVVAPIQKLVNAVSGDAETSSTESTWLVSTRQ
ncbi:family 20 glycosylhydrolase [Danxiaibacter flavus]|uniref:Family 20 glycosylhydrolase n=1 Tax=Danxiaibacter flavus TaxID=3049108 RepID=A0ABV3ZCK8_9BACT|nr:family 20 glycosylhydrolase [Chitinophagaceae bacterium DXS]